MTKAIVWTIAGSDSSGGAGIQADLLTFNDLGAYGCSVITALTAQSSVEVSDIEYTSNEMISAQMKTVYSDLPPAAIKLGMIGSTDIAKEVCEFLPKTNAKIVCDPVMVSTCGDKLIEPNTCAYLIKHLFPLVDLITPNIAEAEILAEQSINTPEDMIQAANKILQHQCKSVLIKGGHGEHELSQDYWTDGTDHMWLNQVRYSHEHNHGAGCTLSSAIAASLSLGHSIKDALVIAKSYISKGIRLAKRYGNGPGPLAHQGPMDNQIDLPWVTFNADDAFNRPAFLPCDKALGAYALVNDLDHLKQLIALRVDAIQLRLSTPCEQTIKSAIEIAANANIQLFINDYWQLAIKHGAYGVHLGQVDLATADITAIHQAGLRLGISTHSHYEIAIAHSYKPSYIAFGTIYPSTSKPELTQHQGINTLQYWSNLLDYPVVAIGGINASNIQDVINTGVNGAAMITALSPEEISAGEPAVLNYSF